MGRNASKKYPTWQWVASISFAAVVVICIAMCSGSDDSPSPTPSSASSASERTTPDESSSSTIAGRTSIRVRELDFEEKYGAEWPLTSSEARIEIRDSNRGDVAVVVVDDVAYALAGWALTVGYPHPNPVMKEDPENPGFKLSISILNDIADEMKGD